MEDWKMGGQKTKMSIAIVLLMLSFVNDSVIANSCEEGTTVGDPTPGRQRGSLDTNKGMMYLAKSDRYTFKCCGAIKNYKPFVSHDGNLEMVTWRPVKDGRNSFTLISVESIRGSSTPIVTTYTVPPKQNPIVLPGDFMGWYAEGPDILSYTVETNQTGETLMLAMKSRPDIGTAVDWSNATSLLGRRYPVMATLQSSVPPKFDNLNVTIETNTNAIVGTPLYKISASDEDMHDKDKLDVIMETQTNLFAVDLGHHDLKVSSQLLAGTYELHFRVTDPCGGTDRGTLTVHVEAVHVNTQPPEQLTSVSPKYSENLHSGKEGGKEAEAWKIGVAVSIVIVVTIVGTLLARDLWYWYCRRRTSSSACTPDNEECK